MSQYVVAIDQGTTSTRGMVFDHDGRVVSADQREHRQHYPIAGWVEHDPLELWANTREVAAGARAEAGLTSGDTAGVGIANQRDTQGVGDRRTGERGGNESDWPRPATHHD